MSSTWSNREAALEEDLVVVGSMNLMVLIRKGEDDYTDTDCLREGIRVLVQPSSTEVIG